MKYRLTIAILLILALSGCNAKTAETKTEDKSVVDEEETSDSIESDTSELLENDENTKLEEYFSKASALQLGEKVQADETVNFSFDEGYWCKEIRPENIEGPTLILRHQKDIGILC